MAKVIVRGYVQSDDELYTTGLKALHAVAVGAARRGKLLNGSGRVSVKPTLGTRFALLADESERETSVLSSPKRKALHPARRAIVEMGADVIPHILRRMKKKSGHWFWALSELTGENPIPESAHGRVAEMREAWLTWGKARGHC